MKYRVRITKEAAREAADAYSWIAERAPEAAIKWFNDLDREIQALAQFPARCPLAPESFAFDEPIHHLIVGQYRVLFTIGRRVVDVLHVRHAAMRSLEP